MPAVVRHLSSARVIDFLHYRHRLLTVILSGGAANNRLIAREAWGKQLPARPNIVFILADQLRASSLPLYGERQIETPHIDRLARDGTVFTNAVASCPVCTPFRSMLLTGRHPQTTGHLINFVRTRHSEISLADALGRAGYRTGWVGKWHLHTGSFPQIGGKDYVPEGRDRLGFQFWRGYNFHTDYFDGWVNGDDWQGERWEGYETCALNRYGFKFMDDARDAPFCLFLSPHQPHFTPCRFAPDEYYGRLPRSLTLPENVPVEAQQVAQEMYRHYLAMTLAVDDMVGEVLDYLERASLAENTLVIFSSDHGTQAGAHGISPWHKKMPYQESLRVPLIMRLPGVMRQGAVSSALVSPVDYMPTLCSLCGVTIPRSVEGMDLAGAWRGSEGAPQRQAMLTMNFNKTFDYFVDGDEWRGVRTERYNYSRWLDGRVELYDLEQDPLEMQNLAEDAGQRSLVDRMGATLRELLAERNDRLLPGTAYRHWLDEQRRVVHNAYGPLCHPEAPPDWSLLS